MKLPKFIGKIAYLTGYPFIYAKLKDSNRSYVVVCYKNKVLLTKNWLGLHRDWRLPGGGIKYHEDELSAVIREVTEEIGVKLTASQLCLITKSPIRARHGYNYRIYQAALLKEPVIKPKNNEIVSAEFIDINTVKDLPLCEIVRTAADELGWS